MSWRRPNLPGGYPPSTLGAGGLNCRVREGTGCTPTAKDTNILSSDETAEKCGSCIRARRTRRVGATSRLRSDVPSRWYNRRLYMRNGGQFRRTQNGSSQKAKVSVSRVDKPSTISTGLLKTLLPLHIPPIQLVVYQRSYLVTQ